MKIILLFSLSFYFLTISSNAQTRLPSQNDTKDYWFNLKNQYNEYILKNYKFQCEETEKKQANAISDSAYSKIIDKYFSFAIVDKENIALGSFASLDYSNNETKLNLNLTTHISQVSFLTVSTSLNVKDKAGSIYTNNSMNSGFSGSVKYSKRWKPTIFYYKDSCYKFQEKFITQEQYIKKSIDKDYYKSISFYARLKVIDSLLNDKKCKVPFDNVDTATKYGSECSALLEEQIKIEQELRALTEGETKDKYFKKTVDSLASFEVSNFKINGVSFWWWSISGGYGSESYDLFDKTRLKPDAPVFSKRHNRFKFGFEINKFFNFTDVYKGNYPWGRSGYLSIGLNWEYDNNINSLTALKTPTILITENNDTLRTSSETDKLTIYDGSSTPFKKYSSLSLSPRYLAYYSKKRIWGIDLFGNLKVNKGLAGPLLNAGLGIVFNVPNSDASKSKISFELFYKLVDVSERLPTSKGNVFERNEIGITAAIPFQKFIL